jgi:hypothetical protein
MTNIFPILTSFIVLTDSLKETVSRDFQPSVFLLNCTPGSPDSWAKTVLHIDSNSRSSSTKFDDENRLRAVPHSGESRLRAMPHCAA